jgi:hypothetical protein
MARPDVSSVTQEEVEALFDKDGDLREPDFDEESEAESEDTEETEGDDEPEAEDQEGDEAEEESEEESEEDEAEEEAPEELDWEEVDPEYKSAFDAVQQERDKLRKDYGKLHSKYTRETQAHKEQDGSLEELRAQAQVAEQWNAVLAQHPDIRETVEQMLARKQDPYGDVPDYLKEDPLFQQMRQHNQRLEQRLSQFEEKVKPVETWQSQQQEAQNRQKLDGLLGEAEAKFKSMFSREWSEDEKTEVLQYMVENKVYRNGKIPVMEVFGDRYEKALKTRQASDLRGKAKRFGTRTKSVNSARISKASKDASNADEAIAMALADQGYGQ